MFNAEEEKGKVDHNGSVMNLADQPPIAEFAAERGLKDTKYMQQSKVEQKIDLVKWSQRSEVKAAWDKLADRSGLEHDAFEKATWGFLGFVFGRNYNIVISMSKARKVWIQHSHFFRKDRTDANISHLGGLAGISGHVGCSVRIDGRVGD